MSHEGQVDTRQALVMHAADLLETHGYNGFSFGDLALRLNIRRASVHHHFPHKEDLGLELIRTYRLRAQAEREALATADPAERLNAFFDGYRAIVATESRICPSGALEADLPALSPEMRDELREMVRENVEWLTETLEEGRGRLDFSFEGEPRDLALLVLAGLQGALQMSRAFSPMFYTITETQLRAAVGLPVAAPARNRQRERLRA